MEQTQKGKVSNSAANYRRVLQYDPLLKGAIRKNLLTERIDIVKPLGWYRENPTLTDIDIKYLLLYFEVNYGLTVEKKIQDAVMVIANENRYHPVCDFLNGLQWDGTERIRYIKSLKGEAEKKKQMMFLVGHEERNLIRMKMGSNLRIDFLMKSMGKEIIPKGQEVNIIK